MSDFISREAVLVQIRVQQSRYVLGSREWLAIANALDAIAALPVEQPCVSCSDEQQCAAYQRGVVAGKRGLPVEQPTTSAEREELVRRFDEYAQEADLYGLHQGVAIGAETLRHAARLLRAPQPAVSDWREEWVQDLTHHAGGFYKRYRAPQQQGEPVAWRVCVSCCGRDEGSYSFPTWKEAETFRESYTSGPGVNLKGYSAHESESGHRRAGIISALYTAPPDSAARIAELEAALREIRDREARNHAPWTHEAAADEYLRMLACDRDTASRALAGEGGKG